MAPSTSRPNTVIRNSLRGAPVTSAITAICIVVFLITALQARSITDVVWDSPLGSAMILWGPLVEGLGYLRPLTAGFLHLDITHLFLNMLMLVFVGAEVERYVGSGPYAVGYLASVLGSSGAVLAFNFATPTAGASGALYALMAMLVAIALRRSVDLRAPLALIAVNVAYTLMATNVSFWGHAGGLVFGALMAWPLTSQSMRTRWVGALAGLALGTAAVWAATLPLSAPVY
ncbi:rhomboid family intramembrane serine protease [Corynebacterium sp. CNCTC7651]|uniref:rhomboid family intramembrane serine protease n=1 Tax=Corynebacterium sp. CNCTC7651 TaxID=2815361 RepID=UPI001F22F37F|nr:rhomboid family intramembrane serine protease [Corynebacterium sp. CNCTC7651]UIZ92178.1 rhomboid family intramembrane serine protease [Corynebacterium sp. CNCTC7651]